MSCHCPVGFAALRTGYNPMLTATCFVGDCRYFSQCLAWGAAEADRRSYGYASSRIWRADMRCVSIILGDLSQPAQNPHTALELPTAQRVAGAHPVHDPMLRGNRNTTKSRNAKISPHQSERRVATDDICAPFPVCFSPRGQTVCEEIQADSLRGPCSRLRQILRTSMDFAEASDG